MEDQILQKYRKYKKVRMISDLFYLTRFGSAVEPTGVFIFGIVMCDSFLMHKYLCSWACAKLAQTILLNVSWPEEYDV